MIETNKSFAESSHMIHNLYMNQIHHNHPIFPVIICQNCQKKMEYYTFGLSYTNSPKGK